MIEMRFKAQLFRASNVEVLTVMRRASGEGVERIGRERFLEIEYDPHNDWW